MLKKHCRNYWKDINTLKVEKNEKILKESIEGLKQSEGPNIWLQIAAELDSEEEQNQEILVKSIQSLSQQEAPDVWLNVSSKLESKSANQWKYLAIAASISLVVLVSYFILPHRSAEEITYSTEQVEFFGVGQYVAEDINTDDILLTYIKENCVRLATTCQDPEFKALLESYMELDATKDELNKALEKAPDQSKVMKYLIKVEKNQTEIGKDMLKKMKSI